MFKARISRGQRVQVATNIEGLERRLLLAVFTVTDAGDSGPGTLRQAIVDANAAPSTDSIEFAIGTGAQTISPLSPLPALSDPAGVIIEGRSQPGFVAGTPLITINGASAGVGTNGFQVTGGSSTISSLIIQNFDGDQIEISGAGGNTIVGNRLLGPSTGGGDGVEIDSANNRVGGPSTSDRNIIAGNAAQSGVRVMDDGDNAIIENNFIGTNVAGNAASANGSGILIEGADDVQVLDNVISANNSDGINISGGADDAIIQGNRIGTNVAGSGDLGNGGSGIAIVSATDSTIGGTGPGDGNTIGFNNAAGVAVNAGVGNLILGNSIFSNSGLGIDLGATGRTANDPDDSDTGANNLQNFPQLTQVISSGGTTTISGVLDSTPVDDFRIEFFTDTTTNTADVEGRTFIGFADVQTNSSGIATFNTTIPGSIATGMLVTATATGGRNTSEFADPIPAGFTGADIQVSGNGADIPNGDTTPSTADFTDFGPSNIGVAVMRSFTITNTGQATLDLSVGGGLTITGPNASQFSVTDQPNTQVAPGQSTVFIITFTPSAAGNQTATVNIESNDPDESPYTFSISGQGTSPSPAPEIEVSGNGVAIASGDTTPSAADLSDFGTVAIGSPATRTFTISNAGQQTLAVGAVTLSGTNASQFSVTAQPATSVAPGQSTTFTVQFSPIAGGVFNATVSIANNDSDENPYTFAVRGLGVAPVGQPPTATLLPPDQQPPPLLNSTVYDFIVRYNDDVGFSASTFDNEDIVVTSPDNVSQNAQFVSSTLITGQQVDVTYRIDAPGGTLDASDSGNYTVTIRSGEVLDTDNNSVPGGVLGTLVIALDARTPIGSFGVVDGRRTKLTFTEPDGTVVMVSLTRGSGQAFRTQDGRFDLELTSAGGRLTVTARGGNGRAEMNDVRVTGALRGFSAKTSDMTGVLTSTGGLSASTLGSTTGVTISTPDAIRALNILGNMVSTQVFSGALLGEDGRFGGTGADADQFAAGEIRRFNVRGSVTDSLIAAGLDPVDDVLLNDNGTIVGGAASRIRAIRVRGAVDAETVFAAGAFPARVRFGSQTILPATDPRFDATP